MENRLELQRLCNYQQNHWERMPRNKDQSCEKLQALSVTLIIVLLTVRVFECCWLL